MPGRFTFFVFTLQRGRPRSTIDLRLFARRNSTAPRLRFAPSPTGLLHLGGLRTALYNYLMCRRTGGTFVLRIEDTDRTRLVPGAVENIQDSLEWMGLTPDEGPRYGGPYGPYVQSERLDLYRQVAEQLVESGAAYRCYCSPLRLELMRKQAVKNGEQPRYDNRCRNLSPTEAAEKNQKNEHQKNEHQKNEHQKIENKKNEHQKIENQKIENEKTENEKTENEENKFKKNENRNYVIRLKMDQKTCNIQDLVYGSISLRVDQEGDPILIKSDGFPTYHLANVVDDYFMKITHVFRGIEWQLSTPKHLQIYSAMGWAPPLFAHLPLLLNNDGSKLSKRKNSQEILKYREEGIFPEAIINLLTQAGGGFKGGVANTSRLHSLDSLIDNFDLSFINRNSCQLNFKKLPEYNRQALKIRFLRFEEKYVFIKNVQKRVKEKYDTEVSENVVRHVVEWATEMRLTCLEDLFAPDFEFVWRRKETSAVFSAETRPVFLLLMEKMEKIPKEMFKKQEIAQVLRSVSVDSKMDFKQFMHLIRVTLCGVAKGPSVAEMAEILGQAEFCSRLKCAMENSSDREKNVPN